MKSHFQKTVNVISDDGRILDQPSLLNDRSTMLDVQVSSVLTNSSKKRLRTRAQDSVTQQKFRGRPLHWLH